MTTESTQKQRKGHDSIFGIIGIIVIALMIGGTFLGTFLLIYLYITEEFEGYNGDYPELYTVAMESLPDVRGYISFEHFHQPVLVLLAEDGYGRKMFCYTEERDSGSEDKYHRGGVNIVICQYADDTYAYYYADCNYISSALCVGNEVVFPSGQQYPSVITKPLNDFTEEQIEDLKNANDWGKELDLRKCVKAEISRKKQ